MPSLKPHGQMSEAFITALFLSVSGGLQDVYTYLYRGKVFANAQTGNIVLMAVKLFAGKWGEALRYLIPLCAFALGIFVAEFIRLKLKRMQWLHWRQLVVLFEILMLFVVGFLPQELNLLANSLCFKKASVSKKPVHLHSLFFKQDIKSHSHGSKTSVQVCAHKVCQIKTALRGTDKQRASFCEAGHVLAGKIAIGKKSTAVNVTFHCLMIQSSKQPVHIHFHSHCLRKFTENIYPGIQIRGTVVGMCHGYRMSGRSCHHINLRIRS